MKNNLVFLSVVYLCQSCTGPASSKDFTKNQRSISSYNNQERNISSLSNTDLQSEDQISATPWYQLKKGAGISNRSAEINNQDSRFSMSINLIIQTAKNVSATARTRAETNLETSNAIAKMSLRLQMQ